MDSGLNRMWRLGSYSLTAERTKPAHPDGHVQQQDLVDGRDDIEAAHTTTEQTCPDLDEPHGDERHKQRQREEPLSLLSLPDRARLRQTLASLAFENRGQLCHANSAVTSFLWASLSRSTFAYSDWGVPAPLFSQMLQSAEDTIDWTITPGFMTSSEHGIIILAR